MIAEPQHKICERGTTSAFKSWNPIVLSKEEKKVNKIFLSVWGLNVLCKGLHSRFFKVSMDANYDTNFKRLWNYKSSWRTFSMDYPTLSFFFNACSIAKARQAQISMLLQFQQPQIFALEISILDDPFFVGWMMNRELHIDDMCTERKIYESTETKSISTVFTRMRHLNPKSIYYFCFCWFLLLIHHYQTLAKKASLMDTHFSEWQNKESKKQHKSIHTCCSAETSDHFDGLKLFCREYSKRRFSRLLIFF